MAARSSSEYTTSPLPSTGFDPNPTNSARISASHVTCSLSPTDPIFSFPIAAPNSPDGGGGPPSACLPIDSMIDALSAPDSDPCLSNAELRDATASESFPLLMLSCNIPLNCGGTNASIAAGSLPVSPISFAAASMPFALDVPASIVPIAD